jgi:murein DD-endopeptidase MepM/ murein hydrolase activator NlpD
MQATRRKSKASFSQLVAEFPRRHLITASLVVAVLFVSLLLIPGNEAQAKRTTQSIAINLETKSERAATPVETESLEKAWREIKVKKGDSLARIFQRAKLSPTTLHQLVSSTPEAKTLRKIYPGQTLAFDIDSEGQLQAVKYIRNQLQSTLFERQQDGYSVKHLKREPELRQRYTGATIHSSLFKAAQDAGLEQSAIMEMANIFGGVIDFVYDVRAGDSFSILYEEQFLDGEKIGPGPILAAEYTNRGQTHTAYRYVNENGDVGYYTKEGISMRKAFLRAPLDFTRISSSFNLKRLHPISKNRRPHRGIDYAAPRGTPVYAAGDGRILKAGYTKANGNYIVISHGTKYQTKYLHLNKRAVKRGQKVKQQQIIGWVGTTGYSTGPHLHYEFLVNGVHRNPRTILKKLPKAKSLASAEMSRFYTQIKGTQLQLAAYNNHQKLASVSQLASSNKL